MTKKNDVQYKYRSHKVIIHFQIGLKIALFSKSIRNVLLLNN